MQSYATTILAKLNQLAQSMVEALPRLVIGLVIFCIFVLIAKVFKKIVHNLLNRSADLSRLANVFSRIVNILIVTMGILVTAGVIFPSVTTSNILSLLGVGGVAIGFAFKDIFQNFLAGILILFLRSFRIGDQIEVEGVEGTVEDIEIRATIIRTYDNRRVVIPNALIFSSKVTVNTAYDKRRVAVQMGIGYGDDIIKAKKVILETLNGLEGVLEDPPPYVLVTAYGGSTVDLEARFWQKLTRRLDMLEMSDAALEAIKPALSKAGIDLPFPTQQILFHDQTEETDGVRSKQREGWPSLGSGDPKPRFKALDQADSTKA